MKEMLFLYVMTCLGRSQCHVLLSCEIYSCLPSIMIMPWPSHILWMSSFIHSIFLYLTTLYPGLISTFDSYISSRLNRWPTVSWFLSSVVQASIGPPHALSMVNVKNERICFLTAEIQPLKTSQRQCIMMSGHSQKSRSTMSSQVHKSIRAKSGGLLEIVFLNHIWNMKLTEQKEENMKEKIYV